jgi:hypothetical protein
VVADQLAREADQDRRQGRQPRPVCDLPDGRGRGAAADVPGNPVADRPAAGTAGAGMTSAGGKCKKRRQPRCALMRAEQHVSVPRCGQLAVLTACRACGARFAVAQDARRDDPGLATIRNPGNVGLMAERYENRRPCAGLA